MPVAVTNNTGTVKIDDGGSQTYVKKEKVSVQVNGNYVQIYFDKVNYFQDLYNNFTAPAGGSAAAVAAAIAVFLNTE